MAKRKTSILLEEELYNKMLDLIPWGYQTQFFNLILKELLEVIEVHGERALLALMSESAKVKEVSPTLRRITDDKSEEDAGN